MPMQSSQHLDDSLALEVSICACIPTATNCNYLFVMPCLMGNVPLVCFVCAHLSEVFSASLHSIHLHFPQMQDDEVVDWGIAFPCYIHIFKPYF